MAFLLIGLVAFAASILSFFSGFGLGTVLLPAFAIFFSPTTAVIASAIVHLANSIFKTVIMRKSIDWHIVFYFGIPAMAAATMGALLLGIISVLPNLFSYTVLGFTAHVSIIKIIIALFITIFAIYELFPKTGFKATHQRHLIIGGLLAGFFGGLSGHQGALRANFLTGFISSPTAFVAINAAVGLLIDVVRIIIYLILIVSGFYSFSFTSNIYLLVSIGVVSALLGIIFAKTLIHKTSMTFIRYLVTILMLIIAIFMALGWL